MDRFQASWWFVIILVSKSETLPVPPIACPHPLKAFALKEMGVSPAVLVWLTSPGSLCELGVEVSLKCVDFLDPNLVSQKLYLQESH